MSDADRQVPIQSIAVVLRLAGQSGDVTATLYLSMTSPVHGGAETLDEFLNAPRRFLPARIGDTNALVARDAIVTLRVPSNAAAARHPSGATPAIDMVRIQVEGEASIDGVILHAAAGGDKTRLSDTFNTAEDFFAVEDERGIVYVSKRRVLTITF